MPVPEQPVPTPVELPGYLKPYQRMVERVGPTFDALLWRNRGSQVARFEAIVGLIDLKGRTVLDAGCGTGDLPRFLAARGVEYRRYVGIDALGSLLETARRAEPVPMRAEFVEADFLTDASALLLPGTASSRAKPDVVVFSGSLNTMEAGDVRRALERGWEAAGQALVFNFLAGKRRLNFGERGPARRLSPRAMLRWALRRTQDVAFRSGYLDINDATIVMRRNASAEGAIP